MLVARRTLQEEIRAAARRLGFALCGFARIAPPLHGDFVRQWLADGNAASMGYIARRLKTRLDPRRTLREARSIITVGDRYLPPPLPPVDWRAQLRGRIAAYALGTDYHRTMDHKLRQLAAFIEQACAGARVRTYVDVGPVLEREWAALGGLGWFGRNTNILHTEEGSYFLLGEVLTSVEFDPDPPVADHCGTCTRCLDLCPTAALQPGYVLDARRCISYWTIEHRGMIPAAFRPQLGNWIFGCDICQEVCPWNEKLIRRGGSAAPDALLPFLPQLLRLDEAGFTARFGDSAIQRAQREGLLRNVAVVLGNTRNPAAVESLAHTVRGDPSAVVRGHAAWALGEIGTHEAQRALERARQDETDPLVWEEIATALGRWP